jgi:hypothetical protein
VYDPSGAASLPDVLPGSVRSVAVDAHRRRYDFRTSHGAMLEVSITSATGLDARYQCGMDSFGRALGCGEYAPWGFPFRLPGALR